MLDMAFAPLSVILEHKGKIYEHHIKEARASDQTHTLIHDVLTQAHITPEDINTFVYNRGPGSFTGIRIAYTLAKAFKLAHPHITLKTVETHSALMQAAQPTLAKNVQTAHVITNAHGGQVFMQSFVRNEKNIFKNTTPLVSIPLSDINIPTQDALITDTPLNITHKNIHNISNLTPKSFASKQEDALRPLYIKPLTYQKVTPQA